MLKIRPKPGQARPDPQICWYIFGYPVPNRSYNQLRLAIPCQGSRSKPDLEPYGPQSTPKPCFWQSPVLTIMLVGGQDTLGSWERLPPAFFFGKNVTPRFGTCPPGHIFTMFPSCSPYFPLMSPLFRKPVWIDVWKKGPIIGHLRKPFCGGWSQLYQCETYHKSIRPHKW